MIKNVIVINDCAYINGGSSKVAIQSAIGLSQKGINVVFFSAIGPIDKELELSHIKIICLNQKEVLQERPLYKGIIHGIWNSYTAKILSNLLLKYSPDDTVIHIHGFTKCLSSSIFKVLKEKKFSVFITLHDYVTTCPNGMYYDFSHDQICTKKPLSFKCMLCNCDKRNYFFKIYRVIRQFVQDRNVRKNPNLKYIYISNKNYKIAKKWLPKNSSFYKVINPIELNEGHSDMGQSTGILLYIGRLEPEKGIDIFCEAASRTRREAIVIGDGEMRKDLVKKYKDIEFTGWLSHEEMEKYIIQASALVFPSRCYECAPLTIIEALSAGLPCIVSDVTSAVEVIRDGINGFIFKSCSVSDLCQKIQKLTSQKEMEMKKNIRCHFERTPYTLESHVERLLEIYNQKGSSNI